ncbi:hypothetical protein PTTG_08388 [Puccinia triticina 1-1 BBBD Race 1]|uniref:Uncharacterized protein n=1 Tax=Puccinia triticina (isolate 1-1 / race 1 (BBBD)) TaxID=630390 RepID=A0A0C4F5I8_PUCT1|nr:hypothetical protein PTTG_08388 [Puccinia triticina 1-1 BBBD Race 1]
MSNPSAETSNQLKASTELAIDSTQTNPIPTPPNPTPTNPNTQVPQAPAASSAPAPKTNPPRAAKTTAPKVTSKATVKQPKKAKETPNREPTDVAVGSNQMNPEIARALV